MQIGNGSTSTYCYPHLRSRAWTHTHRSVSGSFGFFSWASCRVCGSDRGASFESRFKCWCTWSTSDSSQMKHNKQKKGKKKKIKGKNRKNIFKIILAPSSTCFCSRWITHLKGFSALQWSHTICCCTKAKFTHSVASFYVWMRHKKGRIWLW